MGVWEVAGMGEDWETERMEGRWESCGLHKSGGREQWHTKTFNEAWRWKGDIVFGQCFCLYNEKILVE